MTKPLAPEGKGRFAFLLFDATFKVVVCTPENEKLLIEIIELLIPGKHISHITFLNKEQHGLVIEDKNVTFDLLCKDKDDALVELTLPKDANVYATAYQLYIPDKKLLQSKMKEWIDEFEDKEQE